MRQQILIVEDEVDLANLICITLVDAGFEVTQSHCGKEGLMLATTGSYDLIMLDVMLPKIDGLEICRRIRQKDPLTAIMILTARNTETDRVMGLNLGADDYLTKPFGIRELTARVQALMRRTALSEASVKQQKAFSYPRFSIDPTLRSTTLNSREIELTSTEFELLYFLASHPRQVFSRTQLLDAVWGYNHVGYEHTVNSHINRLRAKLEFDESDPKLVHTIWGVGYKFEYPQLEKNLSGGSGAQH